MNTKVMYQRRQSIANDEISFEMERRINDGNGDEFVTSTSNPVPINNNMLSNKNNNIACNFASVKQPLWRIRDEDVTELPEIYPRLSSPLIIKDCEIPRIGERLFEFLKANSICSVYDPQGARVFCFTNRASFVVQFWRKKLCTATVAGGGKTNETKASIQGNIEEEIILEVQRRKGCSYAMHKIRTALRKSILPPSETPASSRGRQPLVRYEKLLLQQEQKPFRRPSLGEMMLSTQHRKQLLGIPPRMPPPIGGFASIKPLRMESTSSSSTLGSLIERSISLSVTSLDSAVTDDGI